MEQIAFIALDDYEGNEELFIFRTFKLPLFYSVAFSDNNHLLLNFYKTYADFQAKKSFCDLEFTLYCTAEYDIEVIIEALDQMGHCSMFGAANRFVMEYLTDKIASKGGYVYSSELALYVRNGFDKYVRECVKEFVKTEEGKDLLDRYKKS